jgi:acetamidase/formamidase
MRTSFAGLAMLALLSAASGSESNTNASQVARHYALPATPANVQWGWYDPAEKPKLVINSGDTVSIETLSHSLGQIKPGLGMEGIVKLRKENDGGGPHSITGPIFVTGAEPGDTLVAVQQTVNWLARQQIVPMSREEAYALTSMVGDCRVTQVVDIRQGVHCMIPKRVFVGHQ